VSISEERDFLQALVHFIASKYYKKQYKMAACFHNHMSDYKIA
jgi:hypothetical protein